MIAHFDHKKVVVSREATFHEADAESIFEVLYFGEIIVSLAEDAAAGMKWVAASIPDSVHLLDESKKSVDNKIQDRVFRFEPHLEGDQVLTFDYKNPWVKDSPVVKTVRFFARVKKDQTRPHHH